MTMTYITSALKKCKFNQGDIRLFLKTFILLMAKQFNNYWLKSFYPTQNGLRRTKTGFIEQNWLLRSKMVFKKQKCNPINN